MNDSNSATTPESIHGQAGDFAGLWGEWTAIDDTTVSFDFVQYDSTWKDDYVNQSGQAFPVFSKKAFDDKGEDWVRDNVVGTGVYQIDEWKRDESVTLKATDGTHHQFAPKTANIKILGVKEPTTRLALLRNGEVDIAHLEPKDAAKLDPAGFSKASTGAAVQLGVFFSGNLWEDTYAKGDNAGQPLPPKATFVHDIPWIGKPGTSHGEGDLEQARNIRTALAWAIDREAVNEKLLAGTGDIVHVEYFHAGHANWNSKWEYGYDPDKSFEIIKAQTVDWNKGQASAADSILGEHAFEVSVYAGPELGGGASITGEVADAVAGYWADIGLKTFTLKFSYATFRPTVVGRSNTHPWITSCDKGKASNPWHFPKGLVQTSLTRGGFSCGFESPEILGFYTRMAEAKDTAAATTAANEYLDYVYHQALQPGVVGVPDAYYFNNNKVSSFEMDKAAMASLNSLWNIELK
jgi:ABC-type transport system substrate-binding protein